MSTSTIQLTPDRKDALRRLLAVPKFQPDRSVLYSRAPSEDTRVECQEHINGLLGRLLNLPGESMSVDVVFRELKRTLRHLDTYDSGERDRICHYLEQIMDILGIQGSGGLLNTWRYGFDPS